MSRIGRAPITIPAGVEIKVSDGNVVTVKGPKGTLEQAVNKSITVTVEGSTVLLTRASDNPEIRALHGLSRTLINNMVVGVTEGYKKELEINGVGYRATKEGKKVTLSLGSHPVVLEENDDIKSTSRSEQAGYFRHRQAEGRPVRGGREKEETARAV